jgi:hypothetical protein
MLLYTCIHYNYTQQSRSNVLNCEAPKVQFDDRTLMWQCDVVVWFINGGTFNL